MNDLYPIVSKIAHESLKNAPGIMPEGPWWHNLESNFCQRPESFELHPMDQLFVSSTASLDIIMRTIGASMVGAFALPTAANPITISKMIRDKHLYTNKADTQDPSQFFILPPKHVNIHHQKSKFNIFKPDQGVCETLYFESPFEPVNPNLRNSYLGHKSNKIACAKYWHHLDGPRPTVIAIHGFSADLYWLNEWFFALPWLYRIGCDILLYTLPFHGDRQTRFSPFSGYGFFAGGLPMTNEAFAQAVFDFRIFLNYLFDQRGVEKVGVTGVSLGGYTSAILAAVEDRLFFSIPNVPVVSLADLILEWFPINIVIKSLLFIANRSIKEIRHFLSVHCPLTYPSLIPKDRLMIIGGVGDRLAPPKHARLLWDHWNRCKIYWFPGSHLIHLDRGMYLRETRRFLHRIQFLET